jgi:hypothetical protein
MPAGATAPVYAPYVEHVAPDTTAAIFWLKNRRPDLWRDKQDHQHELGENAISQLMAMVAANGRPRPGS